MRASLVVHHPGAVEGGAVEPIGAADFPDDKGGVGADFENLAVAAVVGGKPEFGSFLQGPVVCDAAEGRICFARAEALVNGEGFLRQRVGTAKEEKQCHHHHR